MTDTNSDFIEGLRAFRDEHEPDILALITQTVANHSPPGSSLPSMCAYHFETGGKRLRALLPLLVAHALDVAPERLIPFGAACEMLHNATLVHDDLQDGDRMRRGRPAIWVKYGEARAINLGDAMLYFTVLLAAELDFPPSARVAVIQRISRETIRVVDGQEREFLLKDLTRPTADEYFRMVEGKTSGLFALPIAGAAELCGAPPEVIDALTRAASHLGVLFQIQDDVLDLYANKGRDQRGSDICEGKISALVIHFLEHAPPGQADWLMNLLQTPREDVNTHDIDLVAQRFREAGSLDFALAEIDRRMQRAIQEPELENHPRLRDLIAQMGRVFVEPIEGVKG